MARVLLDCDGVLADYTGQCSRELKRKFGITLDAEDLATWDFSKQLAPVVRAYLEEIQKGAEFWEDIDRIEGADAAVTAIQLSGHEIHVVTSPHFDCIGWAWSRRKWLKRHFGIKPENVTITQSKFLVGGDVFVDDKPEHVTAWVKERTARDTRKGRAFLVDAPYNQGVDVALRIRAWDDNAILAVLGAADMANAGMTDWRAA